MPPVPLLEATRAHIEPTGDTWVETHHSDNLSPPAVATVSNPNEKKTLMTNVNINAHALVPAQWVGHGCVGWTHWPRLHVHCQRVILSSINI